jgi:hypothetical protein
MFSISLAAAFEKASQVFIGDRVGGWYGPAEWARMGDGSIRVGYTSPRDHSELGVALLQDTEIAIDNEGVCHLKELQGDRAVYLRFSMVRPMQASDFEIGASSDSQQLGTDD